MMFDVAIESRDSPTPRARHRANPRAYHQVDSSSSPHLREYFLERDPEYPEVLDVGRGEAIQALTRDVLIRRSLEMSPNGFITIISIIQGVALALLAQNTFPSPSALVICQSIALMLVFVTIFYYYLTLNVLIRWAPSFLDCVIPFAVAGLEIPPAFFLGNTVVWSLSIAALWLFFALALWITTKWSPPSHFGKVPLAHHRYLQGLQECRRCLILGGAATAACGVFAALDPGHKLFWGLAATTTVLGAIAAQVWRIEIRVSQIHALYGVNRPPFN